MIDNDVFQKVMHWVNKSEFEVSGLGTIRMEEPGILRVVSAMLLPQKNGFTHTDIEAEEVNKALFELRDQPGDLRWWWHSHVNMSVFWSGTDMDTIKKIGAGGWFACTVFNKKRETRSACWVQHGQIVNLPWKKEHEPQAVFLDELDTKVQEYRHPDAESWDSEYEQNVTNMRRPSYPMHHYQGVVPWEKRGGVWTPVTSTGTTTQSNSHGSGGITDAQLAKVEPPASRPPGMKKRDYKRWKKAWRERDGILQEAGHRAIQQMAAQALEEVDEADGYGFSSAERTMLAQEGWDIDDIDHALDEFSPLEILQLARGGVQWQEVEYMLAHNYSAQDVIGMVDDWRHTVAEEVPSV